ncbi:GntR family transcriptional regulator [Streptomyces hygroscopicus]|uniref:GntR family transcriptional regulator n=1 Tax=Streptomyces hygroscopicus TaxID=1912 RepID=UPI00223F9ECA|nr:GntR family transcriptional regulator [Streptomyces hygroscopicus]MCW7941648.1 GntR family transcriptional regulator [Streptomyces hygroscopicus]
MGKEAQRKTPRYLEIAAELRAAINRGDYKAGDRLPSESELREQHSVARGTARDALALLAAEGLTEARRGSGVYVRSFKMIRRNAAQRLSRSNWGAGRAIWDADAAGRRHDEDTQVDEIDPPTHIAGTLGLQAGKKVWRRRRLHRMEGRVVQQSTSYLPSDIVAGSPITQPNTGPGGTYARLDELGHGPERFREEVRVRMPLPEEVAALGIASGTPVMLIARTAFDQNGRPVEVNEMLLDGSNYVLEYDFTS